MRLEFAPYFLNFKESAGTSRGVLTEKVTFLIKVFHEDDPQHFGIGEASVFPGLSPEYGPGFIEKLQELKYNIAEGIEPDLNRYSSIKLGIEQAYLDFANDCKGIYYPGEFTQGESFIKINGLIWMGDFDRMIERIEEKLKEGFHCLKLKIGAIDWKKEIEMISFIRRKFDGGKLTLRLDANGAFPVDEALQKLYELSEFDIHSIEQPIKAGNIEKMAWLCRESPVPIALDEELIGINNAEKKGRLLDLLYPQYIILKPSLCGGFMGAMDWISAAINKGIGWWITSALESNVGLNAIAQWTSFLMAKGPQGLGTGELFTNNFSTPVFREGELLEYNPSQKVEREQFRNLDWQ